MNTRRPRLLTVALLLATTWSTACQSPTTSQAQPEELLSHARCTTPTMPATLTPPEPREQDPAPAVIDPEPATVAEPVWPTAAPLASELLAPVDTEELELDTTAPLAGEIDDVVLSEDGTRIAFRFRPNGTEADAEADLYITYVGDDRAQLVAHDVREFAWSADGRVLAVVRTTQPGGLSSGSMDDVVVEAVDTELGTTVYLAEGKGYDFELQRGGVQVASDGMVSFSSPASALWIYDALTTTRTRLSDHSIQASVFSRDGARLAFVRGNHQGTLKVYDRATDAIWTVAEQTLTGHGPNGFSPDATRLAWATFLHGERRLEVFDLDTGEVRRTAPDGRHFALSNDWSRAYYLRDSDSYVPFGTLCEWDFDAELETVIDDNVRGGLGFAKDSSRVLYKDDYEYHMVGGSPFDLRAWDPATGESVPVADSVFGFQWLDAAGTVAMVDHDASYGTCQATAYGVFAEGEAAVEACMLYGNADDGRAVLGHYDDGHYALHLWSPWEAETSPVIDGVKQLLVATTGSRLLYSLTDEAGHESLTLARFDSPEAGAWIAGAEETRSWALTDHVAVGTSRMGDAWTLHVATF